MVVCPFSFIPQCFLLCYVVEVMRLIFFWKQKKEKLSGEVNVEGREDEVQFKPVMYLCIYVFVLQLSFSPTTPMSSHIRVLTLLVAMLLSCCGLAVVCGVIGYTHGMHTLAFMAAEVRLFSYGVVSALLFTPQLGLCDISWLVVGFLFVSQKQQLQRCIPAPLLF